MQTKVDNSSALIPCIGALDRGKIRLVIRSGVLPVESIVLTNLPLLQAAGVKASGFICWEILCQGEYPQYLVSQNRQRRKSRSFQPSSYR